MKCKLPLLLVGLTLLLQSCFPGRADKVVVLQPLGDFSPGQSSKVYTKLKAVYPNVILRRAAPLLSEAYYSPRNRYRADSIIRMLAASVGADTVIVGLTDKDISTTKGTVKDWGVMGLGYRPGKACVISTFRVNKTNLSEQFYKVVIHEIGHTQGLPHCGNKSCFMRDAEGGNPLDEEAAFCVSCRSYMQARGFHFR